MQSLFLLLGLTGFIFFNSCSPDNDGEVITNPALPVFKPDIVFYGLSNSNQLIKLNAKAPGTVISTTAITGLPVGEKIIAIDFRPATGQLYGLGFSSHLYIINHETGAVLLVNAVAFSPGILDPLSGDGFDFNPTSDQIRLVTVTGQNLRLNPETGTVAGVDVTLNPNFAGVGGAAYNNNFSGSTTTTLYDVDLYHRTLYKQAPPNNGTLSVIAGFAPSSGSNSGGFDISPDNSVALASYNYGGAAQV